MRQRASGDVTSPDDVLAGLKVRYRVGSSATTYLSERPE